MVSMVWELILFLKFLLTSGLSTLLLLEFTPLEKFLTAMNYAAGYQGALDGILNYPFFYTIRSVFQSAQTMNNFQSYYQAAATTWPDQTLLGNFVDNHDNPRFLYQNGNQIAFHAALAFSLSSVGIPIIYYGDEQDYGGGPDPACREQLWTNMNTSYPTYNYIATIVNFRKQTQFYNEEQIQRWSDDTFYAFTRGQYFFAFTNTQGTQQARNITYQPYSDGTVLCNLFYATDCVQVENGQFPVYLNNGEVKILSPQSSVTNDAEILIAKEDIPHLYTYETIESSNESADETWKPKTGSVSI